MTQRPIDRHIGLAIAADIKSLYWHIDMHGDPNLCEISMLTDSTLGVSVCMRQKVFAEKEDKDDQLSEVEFFGAHDNRKWITPEWGDTNL